MAPIILVGGIHPLPKCVESDSAVWKLFIAQCSRSRPDISSENIKFICKLNEHVCTGMVKNIRIMCVCLVYIHIKYRLVCLAATIFQMKILCTYIYTMLYSYIQSRTYLFKYIRSFYLVMTSWRNRSTLKIPCTLNTFFIHKWFRMDYGNRGEVYGLLKWTHPYCGFWNIWFRLRGLPDWIGLDTNRFFCCYGWCVCVWCG